MCFKKKSKKDKKTDKIELSDDEAKQVNGGVIKNSENTDSPTERAPGRR